MSEFPVSSVDPESIAHRETRADISGDASGSTLDVQKSTMDTVTASYPSPHMVLQHSVIDSVIETTVYGLEKIKNAGYKLVTVDECLGGNGMSHISTSPDANLLKKGKELM